ncbi:MAG: glutamate 5-kinase [Spirochaetaceae bacterium]|nr:MAG: glutamate 5-kinase [Spirochaetaceae bacterium]
MRSFDEIRRVVVKVGTNVVSRDDRIDEEYIRDLAKQIVALREKGREVCIVTSGAIGLGARELGIAGRVQDVVLRQACAAVGQPLLMQVYRSAFAEFGLRTAQVLLTREVLNDRESYVRLRNAVERLMDLMVIPVFNENDSVAVAEIGRNFGDNDQLSALIASKVDAGLLVLLSDVQGYYNRDPRLNPDAILHQSVETVTSLMIADAGRAGSAVGTGGMATKLKSVRIAAEGGCRVVLAHGREPRVLQRILEGEPLGTVFASRRKLKNRSRWILHNEPRGRILVDEGALEAIRRHKSLLPRGIVGIEGVFEAGDVVQVNECAKLVSAFDSRELAALAGKHSSEAGSILRSRTSRKIIARPEDMVFFDDYDDPERGDEG